MLTLPALKENVHQNYGKLAAPLREDFEEREIEWIYQVFISSLFKNMKFNDNMFGKNDK